MSCLERLATYLREQKVPFTIQHHSPAFTAQEVAASEHLPAMMMAKVVVVVADEQLVMVVLPAPYRVDMSLLYDLLGARQIELADEPTLARAFPDCDVGAMPPFGNLYGIPVFVARELTTQDHFVFQAGTHTDTMAIACADYARLVMPVIADFTRERGELAAPEW